MSESLLLRHTILESGWESKAGSGVESSGHTGLESMISYYRTGVIVRCGVTFSYQKLDGTYLDPTPYQTSTQGGLRRFGQFRNQYTLTVYEVTEIPQAGGSQTADQTSTYNKYDGGFINGPVIGGSTGNTSYTSNGIANHTLTISGGDGGFVITEDQDRTYDDGAGNVYTTAHEKRIYTYSDGRLPSDWVLKVWAIYGGAPATGVTSPYGARWTYDESDNIIEQSAAPGGEIFPINVGYTNSDDSGIGLLGETHAVSNSDLGPSGPRDQAAWPNNTWTKKFYSFNYVDNATLGVTTTMPANNVPEQSYCFLVEFPTSGSREGIQLSGI